jgi:hypothetical protein
MTIREVLTAANDAGIVLEARGETLHVEAPIGAVTPDLRAALATHKPNLLEVIWRLKAMRRLAVTAPRPCAYACDSARGGPGRCFSCGDRLEHSEAYGRCGSCDVAADAFYATQ